MEQWRNGLVVNPLSANPTNCSNTLKQFVGNFPTNCLSVFDHFVKLALKGLRCCIPNPEVPCSKSLGGFKVDSVVHPSVVGKNECKEFLETLVKIKLPPRSGSSLETLESHPYRGTVNFF